LSTITEDAAALRPDRLLAVELDEAPSLSPSPSITEHRFAPIALPTRRKEQSSPAREFMDMAMHGPKHSPTDTPGHRTLLGTERYRDTRFGDLPTVQWGTPSVDMESATPRR
jgi:hypothetical protein